MFNKDEEYNEATRYASINRDNEEKSKYGRSIRLNIAFFMILFTIGYYGYHYVKDKEHSTPYLTNVMGVSHTYNEKESFDEEQNLVDMLNQADVDSVTVDDKNLVDEMNSIVNASTVKNDSAYMKALSSDMEENHNFN